MENNKTIGIIPASAMREQTKRTAEFEAACIRVMTDVEKAAASGVYHTLFIPRPYHLMEDIRSAFQKERYQFQPVGMEVGVMQRDEYI